MDEFALGLKDFVERTRDLFDDWAAAGLDVRLAFRPCWRESAAWRNVAFVVENPTVLAALIKQVRQFVPDNHPTLICTNGNLNLADKPLLDALVQRGAHLFYGGDFDAKGLEIAALVLARYPGAASPWRMTVEDSRNALRTEGRALEPGALDRAARTFPALAAEIAARGPAAHQEGLIPALTRDLSRLVQEGSHRRGWEICRICCRSSGRFHDSLPT